MKVYSGNLGAVNVVQEHFESDAFVQLRLSDLSTVTGATSTAVQSQGHHGQRAGVSHYRTTYIGVFATERSVKASSGRGSFSWLCPAVPANYVEGLTEWFTAVCRTGCKSRTLAIRCLTPVLFNRLCDEDERYIRISRTIFE